MDGQPDPVGELLTETELKPVRPGRASGVRARLLAAAWLLGLAGVAGLAILGRPAELRIPGVTTAVAVPSPPTLVSPPPATVTPRADRLVLPPRNLTVLTNPAASAVNRPTLGDDGLMGGLVFPED